jgi:hypothetical protein
MKMMCGTWWIRLSLVLVGRSPLNTALGSYGERILDSPVIVEGELERHRDRAAEGEALTSVAPRQCGVPEITCLFNARYFGRTCC